MCKQWIKNKQTNIQLQVICNVKNIWHEISTFSGLFCAIKLNNFFLTINSLSIYKWKDLSFYTSDTMC